MSLASIRLTSIAFVLVLTAAARARAGSFVLDPPSPSWPDANDILRDRPGPVSALPRPGLSAASLGLQAQDVIDALSDGRDPVDGERHPGDMHLIFSVSRDSAGLPGTAVRQERAGDTAPPAGAQPSGHAADLFVWDGASGVNALAAAPLGWSLGSQTGDEANAHLRLPAVGQPGDNVNGYDRSTMGFVPPGGMGGDEPGAGGPAFPPRPVFFSLANGSPTLAAIGATGGDVLAAGGPFGASPVVFIPHAALALPPWADLDALNLEVRRNAAGALAPWRLRFSVSSATLGFALPNGSVVNSGAHILASAAGGNAVIAIAAAQLGLRAEDDVDALESAVTQDGVEAADDLADQWIIESAGRARVQRSASGDGVAVSEVGPGGEDGVAIDFPPALGVGASIAGDGIGALHVQPVTAHDGSGHYLLPYLEQDNVRRRIGLGVAGRAEGWVGVGAEASLKVEGWRGDDLVHRSDLDSMSEMGETESLRLQLELTRANGIIAILIGLLTSAPGSMEVAYDLRTDGNSLVVLPDPGVLADRVRVTIRWRPGRGLDAQTFQLSGLEITGDGVESFEVQDLQVRRGLLSGGRAHSALGQALVGEAVEGGIDVSSLGADGEDGVEVDVSAGADAVAGITPDQKAIIGGLAAGRFSARFGVEHVRDGKAAKNEVAIESIEGGLAVSLMTEVPDEGSPAADGGGAGLLSSPLGTVVTGLLPAEVRLGRGGIELVYVEEVSFAPADGSALRRSRRHVLGGLWDSSAAPQAIEIRAGGISSFRVELLEAPAAPAFRRGDADGSSVVEITDAIGTLNFLFLGQVELRCLDAADANDDGEVSLSDAITTLSALFLGTSVIPAPGMHACGADPTADALGCQAQDACR
jgi:hypothetical protein